MANIGGLRRVLHWGPLTALFIIIFLFVCSILATAVLYFPKSPQGIANIIVLLLWLLLILNHFFKALLLGPGLLPLEWRPSKGEEKFLQWCRICNGFKAPRSHHCRSCNRCILKMDHHCPWINNCVGHYNHRSFTLFLAFVVIGCTHATCILVQCLWSHLLWDSGHLHLKVDRTAVIQMNAKYLIFFFFGVGLSVGVTASVGFLLYYQVKSIVKNATGIEMWILEKACRPGNQHFVYPYNLGFWDNVNEVLNLTLDYKGDGISWPIREKCHKYAFTMEQINQKAIKRQTMVVYNVTTEYRGSCMFYKWTMRSCMETPCCDETLLAVRPGDTINVSRWKREWLYGEVTKYVQDSGGEVQILKGWIPRAYASPTTGIHVSIKKME